MCKKTQFKYCPSKIDPCMVNLIAFLNRMGIETFGCCCGHGEYPMTIVVRTKIDLRQEIVNDVFIPRKKKFYRKDKQGYYYIPEVSLER